MEVTWWAGGKLLIMENGGCAGVGNLKEKNCARQSEFQNSPIKKLKFKGKKI